MTTKKRKFKLRPRLKVEASKGTIIQGESLVVPDMSYTVRELLQKFTAGNPPPIMREAMEKEYFDEKGKPRDVTFEDYNPLHDGDADLADKFEMEQEYIQKQRTINEKLKRKVALKREAQKERMAKFAAWEKYEAAEQRKKEGEVKPTKKTESVKKDDVH